MNRILILIITVLLVLSFISCATVNLPVAATSQDLGRLVGTSSGTIWLGIFGSADASIMEACRNGGIIKISTVDLEKKLLFLGLGVRYTCTVTGE
jgi:hypothetical protein